MEKAFRKLCLCYLKSKFQSLTGYCYLTEIKIDKTCCDVAYYNSWIFWIFIKVQLTSCWFHQCLYKCRFNSGQCLKELALKGESYCFHEKKKKKPPLLASCM